ncbi:flavin reductase family protein [Pokkaliibacter sp. MBI-7]|uniref:flavin reductase family protein n=1 Tax=Pokkaliibacter sp. MBI-7 TaxID=3040600 RepID=UPI0024478ABE|nr:flavin reductase family protein [Pokkaliibacter sp. MBI-7]MDH2432530.1 flavin reductase family protein [Pokkaliibacter sp. MBI-7]
MTTTPLLPEGLVAVGDSDPRSLRNLLGQFATGVTIITTLGADGRKIGMTANSFSSVSLDPALVLWSLARTAPSLADFVNCSHFAINILRHDQHGLSNQFARPASDKFAGVEYDTGTAGVPLIRDAIATLICRNHTRYDGGDHLIFIGAIEHYQHAGGAPLVFHAGQYRAVSPHPDLHC